MWLAISLGLVALIALLSLLGSEAWIVRVTPSPLQKLLHVVFYAALTISLLNSRPSVDVDPFWLGMCGIGATALGGAIEWMQSFRPGRRGRLSDVSRNVVGVIAGEWLWATFRP